MKRWVPWIALALVVVGALAVGARPRGETRSNTERVEQIAREVRCPTCRGLSVAESDAITARAVRDAIQERVEAGASDEEIRAYLVSRYGRGILLRPESGGVAGLVWALPVVALVGAVALVVGALRKWSPRARLHASVADETLVARQLSDTGEG